MRVKNWFLKAKKKILYITENWDKDEASEGFRAPNVRRCPLFGFCLCVCVCVHIYIIIYAYWLDGKECCELRDRKGQTKREM